MNLETVVCISNILNDKIMDDLIVGEVYEAIIHPEGSCYQLEGKNPKTKLNYPCITQYSVKLFKRLDELREDKLKEIGI
jgi:hypothetical protein